MGVTRREAIVGTTAAAAVLVANMAVGAAVISDIADTPFLELLSERDRLLAEFEALPPEACFEDRYARLQALLWDAEVKVLRTPVHSLRAIAEKLRVLDYEMEIQFGDPEALPLETAISGAVKQLRAAAVALTGGVS